MHHSSHFEYLAVNVCQDSWRFSHSGLLFRGKSRVLPTEQEARTNTGQENLFSWTALRTCSNKLFTFRPDHAVSFKPTRSDVRINDNTPSCPCISLLCSFDISVATKIDRTARWLWSHEWTFETQLKMASGSAMALYSCRSKHRESDSHGWSGKEAIVLVICPGNFTDWQYMFYVKINKKDKRKRGNRFDLFLSSL